MEKVFIHNVIGRLEWDLWKYGEDYFCTRNFEFIGKEREFIMRFVVDEEETITKRQVEKYEYLMENSEQFFDMVANAILEYYMKQHKYLYNMPEISTIEELERLLFFDGKIPIFIENDERDDDFIGVALACKWEEEHGLGVKVQDEDIWREENDIEDFKYKYLKFQNNKAIEVGFQDIIL